MSKDVVYLESNLTRGRLQHNWGDSIVTWSFITTEPLDGSSYLVQGDRGAHLWPLRGGPLESGDAVTDGNRVGACQAGDPILDRSESPGEGLVAISNKEASSLPERREDDSRSGDFSITLLEGVVRLIEGQQAVTPRLATESPQTNLDLPCVLLGQLSEIAVPSPLPALSSRSPIPHVRHQVRIKMIVVRVFRGDKLRRFMEAGPQKARQKLHTVVHLPLVSEGLAT